MLTMRAVVSRWDGSAMTLWTGRSIGIFSFLPEAKSDCGEDAFGRSGAMHPRPLARSPVFSSQMLRLRTHVRGETAYPSITQKGARRRPSVPWGKSCGCHSGARVSARGRKPSGARAAASAREPSCARTRAGLVPLLSQRRAILAGDDNRGSDQQTPGYSAFLRLNTTCASEALATAVPFSLAGLYFQCFTTQSTAA